MQTSTSTHPTATNDAITLTRPMNLARQLECKLWEACLGYCGEDQLTFLATRADDLPNSFKFHPFQYIN
jgi:hypothetical protein